MVYIEMAAPREAKGPQVWEKVLGGLVDGPPMIIPRKDSYIWLVGNEWPVPFEEDRLILRIEAFGDERRAMEDYLHPIGHIGRTSGNGITDWIFPYSEKVSKEMRSFAPAGR